MVLAVNGRIDRYEDEGEGEGKGKDKGEAS